MVWFIFVFIIKKWEIVFAIQGTVILFHWFDLVIHKVLNLVLIIKFYTSLLKHYLTRMICIVLLLETLLGILFIWIEISCPHNHGFMDPIKYKSWQIMVLKKSLFQRLNTYESRIIDPTTIIVCSCDEYREIWVELNIVAAT